MGLLQRLLHNAFSKKNVQLDSPTNSNIPSARLPEKNPTNEIAALTRGERPINSTEQALDCMYTSVVPLLEFCLKRQKSTKACALELAAYRWLIKPFEEPAHYDRCFEVFDKPLYQLAQLRRKPQQPHTREIKKLLFFIPALDSKMAHISLLCDLIEAYLAFRPEEASQIELIGMEEDALAHRITALHESWGVQVHQVPLCPIDQLYEAVVDQLLESNFDRIIFTAVPCGLSYVSGLVAPHQLGWLSMKYELSCFSALRHRYSFTAGTKQIRHVNGHVWRSAPPLFTDQLKLNHSTECLPAVKEAKARGTVFYTINREEKIRNPDFLNAVAQILHAVPASGFVWTGRSRLEAIDEFFADQQLAHRHFFAGWVEPDALLHHGDIFLDTPVLSGMMAAKAIACGKPVLTPSDSHAWINFFWDRHTQDDEHIESAEFKREKNWLAQQGVQPRCDGWEQYAEQAVVLARSPEIRQRYAHWLRDFAQYYFFNAQESARWHSAILNSKSRSPVALESER